MTSAAAKMGLLRNWLRETAWHYLLGLGLFMMVAEIVFSLGAERGTWRASFKWLPPLVLLLMILGKLVAGGYGGLQRWRAAQGASWTARLAALLPQPVLAWARTDRANMRSCLAWLLRQPAAPLPPGQLLHTSGKSIYGTVFAIVLFSALVDFPLNAFIISVMVKDPALQSPIHIACIAIAVYTLMWVTGDRHAVLGSAHVAGEAGLELRVGNRLTASIPWSAIVHAEVLSGSAAAWRAHHAIPAAATLRSTPADPPNAVLRLDPRAGVRLRHWQVERPAPEYLLVYLDQPSLLVAAVSERKNALSLTHA